MTPETPVHTDIVLVGGGHAHVAVLKRFGMKPSPGVRLTLVTRDLMTPYSGMLPGLIAGHYSHDETHIDLQRLGRFAGARVYHATATGIDTANRLLHCADRPDIAYDLLSIDIGSTPLKTGIAGADDHAIPVKPVDRFLTRWQEAEAGLVAASGGRIVVVGAGAGGVELALSLRHRLASRHGLDATKVPMTVLTDRSEPLPGHSPSVRAKLKAALGRDGIELLTGCAATAIGTSELQCADGRVLPFDVAILVTGAAAPAWLGETGLALDDHGFIAVDADLQSTSHPGIFAAGDIASFGPRQLPKSGVYAVREGPTLAENLRRLAEGRPPAPYRPQPRTLALISTGKQHAIASWGDYAAEGDWVWRLKDWIDRRWMLKYQELPAMDSGEEGPKDAAGHAVAMRCGGCGAKVSSAVLSRVLARLAPQSAEGLLIGIGQPDDAAVLEPPAGKLLVQTVDQFRSFIDDPYLFGRIAANHCLGDLYAMGATPHSALAMVTLPYAEEAKLEADLHQILAGALSVLEEAGVALAGGHTGEGAELSFGLSLNGWVERDSLLRKAGLRQGDALILTKPLGTGAIFAADMRGEASAVTVQTALASMQRSNGAAADILRRHGAQACTDVTGFGLAGHLIEMLKGSGVSAELELAAIPALPGALDLIERGVVSSLQPANEAFAIAVDGGDGSPACRLLYDPQTAGGLLAGIPAAGLPASLAELREAGFEDAAEIGRTGDGMPGSIRILR